MRESVFGMHRVYGTLRPVYLFFAILTLFLLPVRADAAPTGGSYVDELVAAARDAGLARDHYWDTLLHYMPDGGGRRSLIADPKFFLAPDGKTNPEAELEATIRGLFTTAAEGDDAVRCRFIARYTWLKERLHIDESRIPPAQCPELEKALANIGMQSAVLVFPAAHGNGPASMFGHTLIRIDSSFKNDLLAHAVNYAAKAEDSNGFVYAFKGIFGLYRGYFSILPYYKKVEEYNGIEHRDIWEYPLNLNQDEIRRMVYHIWELRAAYSRYYFFDENCSFDLLFLLDAARPSLRLTDEFWDRADFWVIPVDTIRAVKQAGLISGVRYRPSQATRIHAIADTLHKPERAMAVAIADQKITPQAVADASVSPEDKRRILDLATELLQYRYSTKQLDKDSYLQRFLPTLRVRSTLGPDPDPQATTPRQPVPPEEGHLPGRIAPAVGIQGGSFYSALSWRAAYHNILDPDDGYVEGAAIDFFDISGRYYGPERSARLQHFYFFDILSLAPRDEFFQPVSWKVVTGFDRKLMRDGRESLIYRINPGGGVTWKCGPLDFTYLMLESDIDLSNRLKDRFSFGVGPSAGILTTIGGWWKVDLSGRVLYYELGDRHRSASASLNQNFRITTNNSLRLSLSREKTFDRYQSDGNIAWEHYW